MGDNTPEIDISSGSGSDFDPNTRTIMTAIVDTGLGIAFLGTDGASAAIGIITGSLVDYFISLYGSDSKFTITPSGKNKFEYKVSQNIFYDGVNNMGISYAILPNIVNPGFYTIVNTYTVSLYTTYPATQLFGDYSYEQTLTLYRPPSSWNIISNYHIYFQTENHYLK